MRIRVSLIIMLLCVLQAVTFAQGKTVRLLTVGNSFADNALKFLPRFVEADGNTLIYARANIGGSTMERHWRHVTKFEADPNDPDGKPYQGKKFSLQQMLTKDKWDIVTIQQVSWTSHDISTYQPYASNLYNYIRQHAPQAKIMVQQIWAYRVDDPRFDNPDEEGKPHSHQAMYELVRSAYHAIAKELNIDILPSGDAMYMADIDSKWGYKPDATFDKKTAVEPKLPDQSRSLHSGFSWRKQKDGSRKLQMDGHHANKSGEYLIGAVWYEVLYDQDVSKNPMVLKDMNTDYAQFLKDTAHKAVINLKAEK